MLTNTNGQTRTHQQMWRIAIPPGGVINVISTDINFIIIIIIICIALID